jgi:hypothetical protein
MKRTVRNRVAGGIVAVAFAVVAALVLPTGALAASATTDEPSGVHSSSAVLNGEVDPTGDPGLLECRFEYVTVAAFEATGFADLSSGGETACSPAPPYSGPTAVSAAISGLAAGEEYSFRIVAVTTSSGTLAGVAREFRTVHGEVGAFGTDGSEASAFVDFGFAFQLGFDAAARRLYVMDDQSTPKLWGFDVSGLALPFPQLAGFEPFKPLEPLTIRSVVADESGTASAGSVYLLNSKPSPTPCLTPAAAACAGFEAITLSAESGTSAVDSRGHLWVATASRRLDEYAPSGGLPLNSVPEEALPAGLIGLGGLAIGADDALYALSGNGRSVWKLDPATGYTGGEELIPDSGEEVGKVIAFDRGNNHLYVGREGAIAEFDAAGEQIDEFGGEVGNPRGLAADPVSHRVYVADRTAKQVRVFEGGAPIPVLGVDAPSESTNTTTTLGGTVNPQGSALGECRFEWVTREAFEADRAGKGNGFGDLSSGGEAQCTPAAASIPADEEAHAVSAAIAGLAAATAYRFRLIAANMAGGTSAQGAFTTAGPPAVETTGSPVPDGESALLSGRIDPHGALTTYHFEYGTQGPCGLNPCARTPEVELGSDEVQQLSVRGNEPFRLAFEGQKTASIPPGASAAQVRAALAGLTTIGAGNVGVVGGRSFEAAPSSPLARYTVTFTGALGGADVGTLIVIPAELGERLAATPVPGGPGEGIRLVASRVAGLLPETTYHYRLVADNENPDGAVAGGDMTLTTHPPGALTNREFPHPPGNDRAWEQVSIPDSGGNPASFALGFSDDGDRAVYQVAGGTPISGSGTFFSQLLAERPSGEHPKESWRQVNVTPRSLFEPSAKDWLFFPSADFTAFIGYNLDAIGSEKDKGFIQSLWRIAPPAGPYALLSRFPFERSSEFFEASDDVARVIAAIKDASKYHLYDISTAGAPQLLDLLPKEEAGGETVEEPAACGVSSLDPVSGSGDGAYSYTGFDLGKRRWLSADGERAIFPSKGNSCSGSVQLYLREIGAEQTKPISGSIISGLECSAAFIRASAEAAFFWTPSRLDPKDSEPVSCSGSRDGDVYSYAFADGALRCVTCVAAHDADVQVNVTSTTGSALEDVGVSQDGSAVYFRSPDRLLAGAAPEGAYRVETASGQLEYVAPGNAKVGDRLGTPSAVSADGSVLVFRSEDPRLDPQGGARNGGLGQYYRYDHRDRSLVCASCPPDGSLPRGEAIGLPDFAEGALTAPRTYNGSPLSADGEVFAFDTPSALVNADQNTTPAGENPQHGQDVYEWRDGRALLISDGISGWPGGAEIGNSPTAPKPAAVSPSGRDVFFFAAAQYTPDALDTYKRLYDARLGGGIRFPAEVLPCPLEVCQGTRQGAPEARVPGTESFTGAGNPPGAPSCTRPARAAHRLARQAGRLRHRARRAEGRRAKALRGKARRLSRRAQQLSKQAKRCRRAERRAGR